MALRAGLAVRQRQRDGQLLGLSKLREMFPVVRKHFQQGVRQRFLRRDRLGRFNLFAAQFPALAVEAPATTRAWIAAVDAAGALVSTDTGAAHLAGMIGVPVVDVFPDAGFDAQTRRWRPWASSNIVVRASELARAPETLIAQALDGL